jgi:hypothetical protein
VIACPIDLEDSADPGDETPGEVDHPIQTF